jgi:2-keto-4-pentenoate hydratase/2-oxohepta-3-ene-1,7-dioic acid hydratase in catechol pathway
MMALRPSKIIGIGRNYVEHVRELGNEMPEVPILFFKPPTALIGSGEPILLPGVSQRVEYEAEIGVVVARRLRNADPATAERAIGGYVCVNDVTCRDLQKIDGQWGRAKGFDTFCPAGPRVATGLDWHSLELRCRVNGVERQRAKATDMHFPIPDLISFLSGIMTLEPGDLIATGTPAGVGFSREPPVFLRPGDEVTVEIEAIGALTNPVRAADG